MLIDIDEWGQVAVVNMLVRYARTQFLDPNKQPVCILWYIIFYIVSYPFF